MSSENAGRTPDPPEIDEEEELQPLPQDYYPDPAPRRSIWETIRRWLLPASLCVTAVSVSCLAFGTDAVVAFLQECWPVALAPFAGWLLGIWAAKTLYVPTGRIVATIDPESHLFRAVFIPDAMFRLFEQSGNNVLYHTPSGMPVYLAEDIDTERGTIAYSWIHELGAFEVMTREEAFVNWRQTLEEVLRENLQLMDHPHVIGLGFARRCLRDQLDSIAEALGLTGTNFWRDRTPESPGIPDLQTPHFAEDPKDEQGRRVRLRDGARPRHSRGVGEAGQVLLPALAHRHVLAGEASLHA